MLEIMPSLKKQFSDLLGAEYVSEQGELMVVQPASTQQLVQIMQTAAAAKVNVDAGPYYIGPDLLSTPNTTGIKLDLGRMNNTTYDNTNIVLVADPASTIEQVCAGAQSWGYHFPGQSCQHKKNTIGETVTNCFIDGEPAFKCGFACICGLEMVTYDGTLISTGTGLIKDLNNYNLTYLLAGYSGEKAVLSKVYLKLMTKVTNYFWLVAKANDMEVLIKTAAALEQFQHNLLNITGLAVNYPDNMANQAHLYHVQIINILQQLFTQPIDSGSFLMLHLDGGIATSASLLDQIANVLETNTITESVIVSDDYTKDVLTRHHAGYWEQILLDAKLEQKESRTLNLTQLNLQQQLVAWNWQTGGVKYLCQTN